MDKLEKMFTKQREFMDMLREHDVLPEFPVDLTTKFGQRLVKEYVFHVVEEICEASYTLKNKMHTLKDERALDRQHYVEELGDAWAFMMEVMILSGVSAQELYDEYCRKNQEVRKRLLDSGNSEDRSENDE